VAWHETETCEQYDKKLSKGMSKEEKKTERIIKKIAKRCPGCRRFINKNGGCPHMTCELPVFLVKFLNTNTNQVFVGGNFVGIVTTTTRDIRGDVHGGANSLDGYERLESYYRIK
jgi:hypothetical protein